MSFWTYFGLLATLIMVVIGMIYLAKLEPMAEEPMAEEHPPKTIGFYYGSEDLFEAAFRRARTNAHLPEEEELVATIKYLYRTQGLGAPLTDEAYQLFFALHAK
jgi:hypothetical protein